LTGVKAAASLAALLASAACRGSPGGAAPAPRAPGAATATSATLARIDSAVRRYAGDRAGRLPVGLADLAREGPPGGGVYLRDVPLDPWGRPYAYAVTDPRVGSYDLRSFGPDALPGTEDDLVGRSHAVPVGASETP
jgi:hypothetical protein